MQSYDPVLIHQAPRSNTNLKQGRPVGPYAFPANTPQHELPNRPRRPNKDIKIATEDVIRQHYTVNGENISWYTVPVMYKGIKRVIYNDNKQTFRETDYMQHVLYCLYGSYLDMNDGVPKLINYQQANDRSERDRRIAYHIEDLKNYAFLPATDEVIINAAIEFQRNVDAHQWLLETREQTNHCPESELRAGRRDL